MRHKVSGYKLGRSTAQRTALRRSLVTELIDHGRIQTTEAKCKAIRDQAEKLVTIAKSGLVDDKAQQVHARRLVAARVNGGPATVRKLFEEIAPRYVNRNGGYTRISKLGPRKGDNAPMAIIEWI
ncbi:MAG: 50S ribosomal protein L17 [Chloroflexi bacterium]|jgi:large subunit ribosomal protein L17|uniref:Large ribosomal subunit protein bL17 n=1 Tax=Candidatus Thermofonsia Clade 3 bacterium TaxID=2364212 RepID=A0A2M8QD76_9CHLR|nr:50S ribosomal protein L17 [Candidatus Roseilinea sp. NK_OTU-006]PJF47757.1 MAG: 50S ribosomal protein L17 [Candidatus Thermofonsia Clade 3 bacterium]RMG61826.1 MAG: 50S ribosomal protein L17 [Chloroflexota bacterium]